MKVLSLSRGRRQQTIRCTHPVLSPTHWPSTAVSNPAKWLAPPRPAPPTLASFCGAVDWLSSSDACPVGPPTRDAHSLIG